MLKNMRAYFAIGRSGLFDKKYYLQTYPDVRIADVDPLMHFVAHGWREGRNPTRFFNTTLYLEQNIDVNNAGTNPLLHFLQFGGFEGRDPGPEFCSSWYLNSYPIARSSGLNPLVHYLRYGKKKGFSPKMMPEPENIENKISNSNEILDGIKNNKTSQKGYVYYFKKTITTLRYDGLRATLQRIFNKLGKSSIPELIFEEKTDNIINGISTLIPTIESTILAELEKKESFASRFLALYKNFHYDEKAEFSIIIPVYNHIDETLKCLISIALAGDRTSLELIIADDCSSDTTQSLFQNHPAIRYFRNENNCGFLQTCNQAAKIARGKYLFLLNNDVIVTPNWLDSIQETFKNIPDAGLIGSKLYNLDLSLQEAGGVIWQDGTGWNYGRNDDPQRPQYNYLREVDYCSGASIAIPKALWDQLGGFDERFSPAYYEDVDLAFEIRKSGYRVLFQPFSRVIHAEGKTSGTDISSGVKRYQEINRQKFREKWERVLDTHGQFDSTRELLFRNRYRKLHALVIDSITPTPDMDCGSIMIKHYIQMLFEYGFDICFIPETNFLYYGRYTSDLETSGIECLYNPYHSSVKKYLQKNGKNMDLVLISRAPVASKYIDDIKKYAPSARIIFNTVDLHFLREERKASLQLIQLSKTQLLKSRNEEISIMRKADQTILVSEYEKNVIQTIDQDVKTTVIPIPSEIPGRTNDFGQRKDILFLSGFQHDPNVDAVLYFVEHIWSLVSSRLPGVNFLIAGSNMPDEISGIRGDNIKILGYIPNLDDVYSTCMLSIAPLRYGAGVKGKVVTSLGYGVPCVCTSLAAEGMNLTNQETIMIADTPEEFAESIFQVYTDRKLWEKLSDNGLVFVSERFSTGIVKDKLRNLLIDTGIQF